MQLRSLMLSLTLAALVPAAARAQARWKEIGRTVAGNIVFVEPRSIKTAKGITSARLQVKFTTPVDVPQKGKWYLSRHDVMFDCAKHALASKSNVYYGDAAGTKVVQRDVNKLPGFGPAITGSMGQIALDYFCKK
jgi:hypothetical protein